MTTGRPRPPVVVLGPTASGKSEVAMAAARAVPGTEIVSVDALQVYRGMDIGTATPTAAEQAAVRHHGIDLVEPSAEMSVAEFRAVYDGALDAIARRAGRALVVAGTGLYLTAVLDRLELPGSWPEHRARYEQVADTDALYAELAARDPAAAAKIEPGNRRRLVRALEVIAGSGRPFSSFGAGVAAFPPTPVRLIGLRWPRDVLASRIERRVEAMMTAGLLAEVSGLHAAGLSRTAAQALGYKELIEHLEGRVDLDDAVASIVVRTRQFAVRQERWFRRDPRIEWFDLDPGATDPLGPPRTAVIAALA